MKITRLVIPAILAFTTPAAAYDCGAFQAKIRNYPAVLSDAANRVKVMTMIIQGNGPMNEKLAVANASRPVLENFLISAREVYLTMNDGAANSCIPLLLMPQFIQAKGNIGELITVIESAIQELNGKFGQ